MMRRAAIGVRAHSGWGALVAVAGGAGEVEVIERRRVVIADASVPGAKQPFHYAEKLGIPEAEKHLANCTASTQRLASAAVRDVLRELQGREFRVVGGAILTASGRTLPPLPQILASHALIHTAEGEFFRKAFRDALEHLKIHVTALPERELEARSKAAFGMQAAHVRRKIEGLGRSLGPPWTQDQKFAALAAAVVLD